MPFRVVSMSANKTVFQKVDSLAFIQSIQLGTSEVL